jgi:hypothetical protein
MLACCLIDCQVAMCSAAMAGIHAGAVRSSISSTSSTSSSSISGSMGGSPYHRWQKTREPQWSQGGRRTCCNHHQSSPARTIIATVVYTVRYRVPYSVSQPMVRDPMYADRYSAAVTYCSTGKRRHSWHYEWVFGQQPQAALSTCMRDTVGIGAKIDAEMQT